MEGLRDKKSIASVNAETGGIAEEKSNYIYDGTKVILETDGSGKVLAENVYGLNLITRTANNERAYYLYNAHGDVTALTDQTGKVLGTYQYDAFGNIKEKTYSKPNPYTYAGYRYDEEMDLYYLNARYYDPKIARFLTEDTYRGRLSDPLSLNLYTYCHNEPIMYIDPSGHKETIGITKDDREKSKSTSTKSTSSKSSTSQSSKTSTSTKTTTKTTTTTTTKPTTTSKPNVDLTIADVQREKQESRQQSKPASTQTSKPATTSSQSKATNIVEPSKKEKEDRSSRTSSSSTKTSGSSNPDALVTKYGFTATAYDWYVTENDGAIMTGFTDGAAYAPKRPQDYNFPFEKNYDQYYAAYDVGVVSKQYLMVTVATAEAVAGPKSTATSSNPSKPVADYGQTYKQAYGTTGKGRDIVGSTFNDIKPTQDIVNPEKVLEYANKLKTGQYIEPIEVVEIPGKGRYIVEGHHRYAASQQTGIPVEIKVRQGNGPTGLPDWSEVRWKNYINEDQFWGD
nr:RHS repeat-associated core domain-containing protein [Anaerosolibacter carboniphilus]